MKIQILLLLLYSNDLSILAALYFTCPLVLINCIQLYVISRIYGVHVQEGKHSRDQLSQTTCSNIRR